jgi:hypothetical protein
MPRSDAIGGATSQPKLDVGVVATNNAGRHALMQRTGSGYLRTPTTARSAPMQLGARAILAMARVKASPFLAHRFLGEETISVLSGLR